MGRALGVLAIGMLVCPAGARASPPVEARFGFGMLEEPLASTNFSNDRVSGTTPGSSHAVSGTGRDFGVAHPLLGTFEGEAVGSLAKVVELGGGLGFGFLGRATATPANPALASAEGVGAVTTFRLYALPGVRIPMDVAELRMELPVGVRRSSIALDNEPREPCGKSTCAQTASDWGLLLNPRLGLGVHVADAVTVALVGGVELLSPTRGGFSGALQVGVHSPRF